MFSSIALRRYSKSKRCLRLELIKINTDVQDMYCKQNVKKDGQDFGKSDKKIRDKKLHQCYIDRSA